jgi:hypothetical protein
MGSRVGDVVELAEGSGLGCRGKNRLAVGLAVGSALEDAFHFILIVTLGFFFASSVASSFNH